MLESITLDVYDSVGALAHPKVLAHFMFSAGDSFGDAIGGLLARPLALGLANTFFFHGDSCGSEFVVTSLGTIDPRTASSCSATLGTEDLDMATLCIAALGIHERTHGALRFDSQHSGFADVGVTDSQFQR